MALDPHHSSNARDWCLYMLSVKPGSANEYHTRDESGHKLKRGGLPGRRRRFQKNESYTRYGVASNIAARITMKINGSLL